MAGIGFELKKLFRSKGVFGGLRAAVSATFITVGPTILSIFMITVVQAFLANYGFSLEERHSFMGATIYCFVFSLILTGGLSMVLSRYVSDKIYKEEYGDIFPSLKGALTVCLAIAGPLGIAFFWRRPLSLPFRVSAYLLFVELCVIWIQAVYVSALRDHTRLLRGFFMGIAVAAAMTRVLAPRAKDVAAVLLSIDVGFLFVIAFFASGVKARYRSSGRSGGGSYFGFLRYLDRHPALFLCGLLQAVGLYVHNFIIWGGADGLVMADTFAMAPLFDVPAFWAFLSVLPTMVAFVVFSETTFFEKYKVYYDDICRGSTWEEITRSKEEMLYVLGKNLRFLIGLQLVAAFVSFALGSAFLPQAGVGANSLRIFSIVVVGDVAFIIMYVCLTMLLYFDDQKGALTGAFIFAASNAAITGVLAGLGERYYGLGFAVAAFLGFASAMFRLKILMANIDYFTFCSQPVSGGHREGAFTRLARRLDGGRP